MGNLHEFVDANIATLHVLMQEKRKFNLLIEESRLKLQSTRVETENYTKQLELMNQDRHITAMRNTTL